MTANALAQSIRAQHSPKGLGMRARMMPDQGWLILA
jgi:hypothetical protein